MRRYRATVTMKKPWTFTTEEPTTHKPTIDDVMECFANDILEKDEFNPDIDEHFEVKIVEA